MEGTCVYLWLVCVVVWQKPTQYCKANIPQLKIFKKGLFPNKPTLNTCMTKERGRADDREVRRRGGDKR